MGRSLLARSYQKKIRRMAFNVKKVRPLFTGVITTAIKYKEDSLVGGILVDVTKKEGTMNIYQTVVAVGAMVKDIKPGDIVCINFKRYLVPVHVPGQIENNKQTTTLQGTYEIPMITLDGVDHLFLQNNDIEYVVEEYDGVEGGGLLQ